MKLWQPQLAVFYCKITIYFFKSEGPVKTAVLNRMAGRMCQLFFFLTFPNILIPGLIIFVAVVGIIVQNHLCYCCDVTKAGKFINLYF